VAPKRIFVDPSRCIGCRACEAACRECDSHKGESMIMVDFIDRGASVATQPTLCMHCEDPVAPCAQVCPALAILITEDGVVQQAEASRCIGCQNCVYACPFGVPKFDFGAKLMKKCNLCYDRTVQDLQPWCTQVCPTDAIWYGSYEEFSTRRNGHAVNQTVFGLQDVRTRNYHVLPTAVPLDVGGLLAEAGVAAQPREEAWVL
jgi:Fe-S-cluster-containing dehydrogenase component